MDKDTMSSRSSKLSDAITCKAFEIAKAISVLQKSHAVTFCQVWIPRTVSNDDDYHVLKLAGACSPAFKGYFDACVKIQDGLGGLALKALDTYKAYFSRNISAEGGLQTLLPATTAESGFCLAICLRNIDTGEVDYAFEFVFSSYENNNNNNDPCVFLESLFLKLESCLPGFEFSSGAQLGREVLVVDVDNLSAEETSFNILTSKKQEKELEDCQERLLRRWKNIFAGDCINHASVEIQEAISILKNSHGLTLCQVWIYPYYISKNEKRAMKLDGYCDAAFKDYYDACVKLQRLSLKTVVTNQPYFSRNINNIIKGKLHALLPGATSSSSYCCLAMSLTYIYTGPLQYVFEFFFPIPDNKDPCVFLESLLVTLATCFPSFKLSSGAQLGPQLEILDGDNLAADFDIFATIKQEEKEDDCMEDVESQTPNATNLLLYSSDKIGPPISMRTMDVSASLNFADLKMKISQRFDLVSSDIRLSYFVNGSTRKFWVQLKGDRDLKKCFRFFKRNRTPRLVIRVSPCTISLKSRSEHTSTQNPSQMN